MAICKSQDYKIYCNTRQAKTTLISTEELQPWDLPQWDQLFVSAATQRSPNFSTQTTTFFGKRDKIVPPYYYLCCSTYILFDLAFFFIGLVLRAFLENVSGVGRHNFVSFSKKSGCLSWKIGAPLCCSRHEKSVPLGQVPRLQFFRRDQRSNFACLVLE